MRICLFVLLMLAWPAAAQSVHKCADSRGGHSYQSQPCAEGEALKSWDMPAYAPSTTPATVPKSRAPRRTATPASQRATTAPRRPAASRDNQHARCLAARASRDSALQKLGNHRRYDDLRRLNERVSAVCNHRGRQ